MTPTVHLSPHERGVFRVLMVEGGGIRVVGVLPHHPRRDGLRFVTAHVVEAPVHVAKGEMGALLMSLNWYDTLPYRSAQNRRDAIRAMRREGLRIWREAMEQMKKPAKGE